FAFVQLGQFDQLQIHFPDCGEIIFDNLNLQGCDFLQALQNVEAPATAVSFQRVGRVGHQLQFAEHELRGHDDAVEESRFSDVGDAAVDDDAGIEDFVAFLPLFFAAEDPTQRGEVQQVAFVGSDNQANVCHQ